MDVQVILKGNSVVTKLVEKFNVINIDFKNKITKPDIELNNINSIIDFSL